MANPIVDDTVYERKPGEFVLVKDIPQDVRLEGLLYSLMQIVSEAGGTLQLEARKTEGRLLVRTMENGGLEFRLDL